MMLRFSMSNAAANAAIKDGSFHTTMETTMARVQPEAVYFTADGGRRTGYMFFDMKDSSDMPWIAEGLFMNLDAKVEFMPAMNGDDVKAGLAKAVQG
jgi:hypothetical protein